MAKRVRDAFAWLRMFMSAQGPPATTRLVLVGHWLFMNRDGSRCVVGVRHLAAICGLDKTTVSQHRAQAIQLGWLIGSRPPRGRGSGELYPAAPDGLDIAAPEGLSGDSGQPHSKLAEVSGMVAPTVRVDHSKCLVNPDVPSLPISTLRRKLEEMRQEGILARRSCEIDEKSLEDYLLKMLKTDPRVPHYLHDLRSLTNLVPHSHRLPGYEGIIQRLIQSYVVGTGK